MTIQVNGSQPKEKALQSGQGIYGKQQTKETGQFKTGEILGNDPNARAQAGQAFMNRNPVPDVKQGIMMSLSKSGQDMAAEQKKTVAETNDGRVTQKSAQVAQAEKKQQTGQAGQAEKKQQTGQIAASEKNRQQTEQVQTPKTAREAVKAEEEKREEKALESYAAMKEVPENPAEAVKAEEENPAETAPEGRAQEQNPLASVGKEDLDNMFLNGEVSLKRYQDEMNARNGQTQQAALQQQNMQEMQIRQVMQSGGTDVLKVA